MILLECDYININYIDLPRRERDWLLSKSSDHWLLHRSPLYWACFLGLPPIVQLLVRHHADVNQPSRDFSRPVHAALETGRRLEVLQALIHAGTSVDIDQQNELGQSPLHICTVKGYLDVMQKLLHMNCNMDLPDLSRKTPLFLAVEMESIAMVEILVAHKPLLNAQIPPLNMTPMLTAAARAATSAAPDKSAKILTVILSAGADPDVATSQGDTALTLLACGKSSIEVC